MQEGPFKEVPIEEALQETDIVLTRYPHYRSGSIRWVRLVVWYVIPSSLDDQDEQCGPLATIETDAQLAPRISPPRRASPRCILYQAGAREREEACRARGVKEHNQKYIQGGSRGLERGHLSCQACRSVECKRHHCDNFSISVYELPRRLSKPLENQSRTHSVHQLCSSSHS